MDRGDALIKLNNKVLIKMFESEISQSQTNLWICYLLGDILIRASVYLIFQSTPIPGFVVIMIPENTVQNYCNFVTLIMKFYILQYFYPISKTSVSLYIVTPFYVRNRFKQNIS